MTVITRFAPSPTGQLHVGNIRTALHNWLLARHAGGRFMLRIDDTDAERSREDYVETIRADLAWLGITPDGEERQSLRFDIYEREFQRLVAAGRVYRCYETAQELDLKRKVLLGRGLPPIYDRAALNLTEADHEAKAEAGEKPHWRFLLSRDEAIEWHDGIRGAQHFDPAQMSDPVIRRADGSWLYMLPSVIDDVDMGITDVLRGEDHVSNTADVDQIAASFDLSRFGRAPARFDEAELHRVNAGIVHRLPYARVAHLLPQGMGEDAWEAIRPNLEHIGEAADWWQVVTGPVSAPAQEEAERDFLRAAAATLETTGADWAALTAALKESTGRKGKALFLPLRQALTGRDHGPDMSALLPLIGLEAAKERLAAAAG